MPGLKSGAELDRQYNPRGLVPDHQDYLLGWTKRSAETRSRLAWTTHAYGDSPAETLDLFAARQTLAPLFIFIHGGYWRALDKRDFSYLAPAFVEAGISLAVVNYGLAPAVRVEEMVRQMLRACSWAWRNAPELDVDPRRIYVGGHSAGGHLTAMMLAARWSCYQADLPDDLVRGGLAISGLYDLVPLARAPFLRDSLQLSREEARRLSPISYRPARRVPLLTAVGGLESAAFPQQNRLIRQRWRHCLGSDVTMPGHHHFSIADALGEPESALFQAALRLISA